MARVRLVTDAAEEVRRSRRVAVVVVEFIMIFACFFAAFFDFCKAERAIYVGIRRTLCMFSTLQELYLCEKALLLIFLGLFYVLLCVGRVLECFRLCSP